MRLAAEMVRTGAPSDAVELIVVDVEQRAAQQSFDCETPSAPSTSPRDRFLVLDCLPF